jgi:hypothetical protein
MRVLQFLCRQIRTGFDKAFPIERDAAVKPIGIRVGPSHASDDHVDVLSALGEKHNRLSGGISPANHDRLVATTQLRLDEGCGVIDASAFKAGQILDWQLALLRSRRDNDGSRWDSGDAF